MAIPAAQPNIGEINVFEDLTLDRQLRLGLESLQFDTATEVQQRVVPAALTGDDLLVSAETGSGKTLAYLVPLAQKILASRTQQAGTLALVLVPTRELARQVVKQCDKLFSKSPLKSQAITGGAEFKYQKALLRKDPEVIVATPGRLLEHLQKGSADLSALQTLVLDEADRMLDLGLREEVLSVARDCSSQPQALLLSATLSHPGVTGLAEDLLSTPQKVIIGPQRRAHGSITHQLVLADGQGHKDKLLCALLQGEDIQRALIFGNRRSTVIRLATLLEDLELRSDCLHGEMTTEERKAVMHRFHEGKINILCASDVAARGLDVKGIDAVINYDIPHSGDDYVHRTGRTGRAGADGLAISLAGSGEWKQVNSIENYLSLKFERHSLPGLKARYDGSQPGSARQNQDGKKQAKAGAGKGRGNKGRHRRGSANPDKGSNDGFAPLKKKGPGK